MAKHKLKTKGTVAFPSTNRRKFNNLSMKNKVMNRKIEKGFRKLMEKPKE